MPSAHLWLQQMVSTSLGSVDRVPARLMVMVPNVSLSDVHFSAQLCSLPACFTGFQLWAIFSFESQSRWLASHYAPSAVAAWPGRSSRMSLLTPIRSLSTACCASKTPYSRSGRKHRPPSPQQRSNIYLQPKN